MSTIYLFAAYLLVLLTTLPLSLPAATDTTRRSFYVIKAILADHSNVYSAGLDDNIIVYVHRLDSLLKTQISGGRKKNLILFMDNIAIRGLYPESVTQHALSPTIGTIAFRLRRSDSDSANTLAWANLLGRPWPKGWSRFLPIVRPVSLSIGFEDGQPIPTLIDKVHSDQHGPYHFNLVIVRKWPFFIALFLLIAIVIWFWHLVLTSSILRTNVGQSCHPAPYSLALSQMAFWFFVITSLFLFLFITTGCCPPLSSSTLTILSISSLTAVGGAFIDQRHIQQNNQNQQNPAQQNQPGSKRSKWKQFFRDIIEDCNGVSFHRFQIVVWTVLLGFYFIIEAHRTLALPELDSSLLLLMGISSGTYLGLKVPEDRKK